jgi:hypothetical protein
LLKEEALQRKTMPTKVASLGMTSLSYPETIEPLPQRRMPNRMQEAVWAKSRTCGGSYSKKEVSILLYLDE